MNFALRLLVPVLLTTSAHAFDSARIDAFAAEVVTRNDLEPQWVSRVLAEAELKQSIIDAMSRPAERTKPWHEYRSFFINEQRIRDGVRFWREHRDTLTTLANECGVPVSIIVAILGIETQYGTRTGSYRVIDALATLAFAYPPRSEFFRSELEQFLLLSREHDIGVTTATGSYAGAMGAAQFISSSYRRYAVDGSGDGNIDLWSDWRDVFASVSNYLHTFGWQADTPITEPLAGNATAIDAFLSDRLELNTTAAKLREAGASIDPAVPGELAAMVFELEHEQGPRLHVGYKNFYVITRYNRSTMYAMAVVELGREIAARVDTQ